MRHFLTIIGMCLVFWGVSTPAQTTWQQLGDPLNQEIDIFSATHAQVAVLPSGQPLVIWQENYQFHLQTWDGTAWVSATTPFLDALMEFTGYTSPLEPKLNVIDEDTYLVIWRDWDTKGLYAIRGMLWDAGRWQFLGEFNVQTPVHSIRTLTTDAGVVVAWRESDANHMPHIYMRSWDAVQGWSDIQQLDRNRVYTEETSAARSEEQSWNEFIKDGWLDVARWDGDLVVAWYEPTGTESEPGLVLQRQIDDTWQDMPVPYPGNAQEPNQSIRLLGDGDVLYASVEDSEGMAEIQMLSPENQGWAQIGFPVDLSTNTPVEIVLADTPDGIALMWVQLGAVIGVSEWDGTAWHSTVDRINSENGFIDMMTIARDFDLAAAADGLLYAVWVVSGNIIAMTESSAEATAASDTSTSSGK